MAALAIKIMKRSSIFLNKNEQYGTQEFLDEK
jgi:hypothetical protein